MQEPVEYPTSYFLSDDDMMDAYSSGDTFGEMDAFQTACAEGDVSTVETMLRDKTAKLHSMTPHKYTPLMLATYNGHADVACKLIEHKVDVNYNGVSETSALICAIGMADEDLFHILIKAGADTSIQTLEGKSLVALAISSRVPELAKHLVDLGVPVDIPTAALKADTEDIEHSSALYSAVIVEDVESVHMVLNATELIADVANIALAAAAEGDEAGNDNSIFNIILAEMKKKDIITEQTIHQVLFPVFKKKLITLLKILMDVAKQSNIDILNKTITTPDPWIFYYVRFKKDIQISFQKACGASEGGDIDVEAYPLSLAVVCDWDEGVQALFSSGEDAHAQARDVAQLCDKVNVYEKGQEATK